MVGSAVNRAFLPAKSLFEVVGDMMILTARTLVSAVKPPYPYGDVFTGPSDGNEGLDGVHAADAERDFGLFQTEVKACDAAAAGHDLDETFMSSRGVSLSLRWVYVLMIQEYARHNGHADFLRERTDGATGD